MNEYHEQDEILRLRSAAVKKVHTSLPFFIYFVYISLYLSNCLYIHVRNFGKVFFANNF